MASNWRCAKVHDAGPSPFPPRPVHYHGGEDHTECQERGQGVEAVPVEDDPRGYEHDGPDAQVREFVDLQGPSADAQASRLSSRVSWYSHVTLPRL